MAGIPSIAPYPLPAGSTLPDNVVRWTLDPERAVLLVHDMQSYFLRPFPDPLRGDLVHHCTLLRKRCAELGVPVAYTTQPGRMTDEERGLLRDFWGAGMRTDPADREVVPELAPALYDWVHTKWRYSAFFRTGLLERMRVTGRDQLILCGVYAHVGVLSTALDAYTNDIQPFLVADALGDFSEADHRLALGYAARCCAMVLTTGEVFAS
jgi:trans-2,3-dihydro-3-hydroxyanthranilic acid synthase